MLKLFDFYIIKKFLSTFFFTVLIFSMISMIVDFSEKVERFIESDISKAEVAFVYYPNFLMFILGLLWPMLTLIAVIFFTSRLANNSEIISIFNAGVSFRRLLRPYMVTATLLTILYLFGTHFLIPAGQQRLQELDRTYFNRSKDEGKANDVHMFVAPDTKIYVNFFRKRDSTARDFRLEQFSDNRLVYMLKAQNAEWLGPPDRWRLSNYEIRTFSDSTERLHIFSGGNSLDTSINLTPSDFIDYKEQQTAMTTPELASYVQLQRERGAGNIRKYQVELARRTAEPITVFILTLIGVSVAARKVRGGMGVHLAIGIATGALFVFMSRFASAISTGPGMPVVLGMWLPNIVFALFAAYLLTRVQE